MTAHVLASEQAQAETRDPGADYALYGHALRGGPYNSHIVSGVVFLILAGVGLVGIWLAAWVAVCLVLAIWLDHRPWKRKVALRAIPGQSLLYAQVLAQAIWDALPWYVLAYFVYVCVAPLWAWTNLAVSSFVMLYGFYMVIRTGWLVRYLWVLTFRWDDAGPTFAEHQANLRTRDVALRHVVWAYFLGNVGLVIRCASQVMTISLFETVRTATAMDPGLHPTWNAYVVPIGLTAVTIWLATSWLAIRRALLIYYRTHRTLHHNLPLYDSIHAIHHRGVLPTPLDSGTISPAEFLITEMAYPAGTIVPNWWWVGSQIVLAIVGHWPSHDAGATRNLSRHHLLHHRRFNVNFGLTPAEDARFGTLYTEVQNAPPTAAASA